MMIPELQQLRSLLVPLVESFEIDDPARGLVAWVPVVGGTFVHPITRQTIAKLKIYGAGKDKVKIIQPMFLRSLPAFSILGFSHPSHLCAAVAKTLAETLGSLGKLRDEMASMGITMDLESDVLRLRGEARIQDKRVVMVSRAADSIVLVQLDDQMLTDVVTEKRSLKLSHDAPQDLAALTKLVQELCDSQTKPEQQSKEQTSRFGDGTSDIVMLTEMVQEAPSEQQAVSRAQPATEAHADPQVQTAPEVLADPKVQTATEVHADPQVQTAPEVQAEPQVQTAQQKKLPAEDIEPLRIDYLFEMTGADTEIWAHENRLRLKIPFKVVQGQYMFYLEQVNQKLFRGVLISPHGSRHTVEVDFTSIMDIKEVFDKVMLGK